MPGVRRRNRYPIYIANNNGTFTAYAVGEKPTADLSVQVTVYDVKEVV